MNICNEKPHSHEDFNFDRLQIPEEELHAIRMNLYHSTGAGYYIFRQFISPEIISHIRSVWPKNEMPPAYEMLPAEGAHYVGCPNYYVKYPDGSVIFYNYMHAQPLDEVTHEVSGIVHMLRSRLSGRPAFDSLYFPRSVSYRVLINRNFHEWIAPHRDFMDWENRWKKKGEYDPSRLQATLFLSERGVDYSGDGFLFETNSGKKITLGGEVPIGPGDLLIWRYGNLHSVENVICKDNEFGFMRIIYPIYDLERERPGPAWNKPYSSLKTRIKSRVASLVPPRMLDVVRRARAKASWK